MNHNTLNHHQQLKIVSHTCGSDELNVCISHNSLGCVVPFRNGTLDLYALLQLFSCVTPGYNAYSIHSYALLLLFTSYPSTSTVSNSGVIPAYSSNPVVTYLDILIKWSAVHLTQCLRIYNVTDPVCVVKKGQHTYHAADTGYAPGSGIIVINGQPHSKITLETAMYFVTEFLAHFEPGTGSPLQYYCLKHVI